MHTRPAAGEAAAYYDTYLSKVPDGDIAETLERDLQDTLALLRPVSEERSLHRYAEGKWTLRGALAHVIDCERLFVFRAFWFARGLEGGLPSFDENTAAAQAGGDDRSWGELLAEFEALRRATIGFVRGLPAPAWERQGVASGNPFTVRALVWITAGHSIHHRRIAAERYLG